MDNTTLFIIYKIILTIIGFGAIFLGYKLFMKGMNSNQGEASGAFKGVSVTIKNFAPGTFFCAMGVIIIVFTSIHSFKHEEKNPANNESDYIKMDSAVNANPIMMMDSINAPGK